MNRHDQASIAIGVFVALFTFIPGFINRKTPFETQFSRGLTRVRYVKRKPTTALHELLVALAAGLLMGGLVWWAYS